MVEISQLATMGWMEMTPIPKNRISDEPIPIPNTPFCLVTATCDEEDDIDKPAHLPPVRSTAGVNVNVRWATPLTEELVVEFCATQLYAGRRRPRTTAVWGFRVACRQTSFNTRGKRGVMRSVSRNTGPLAGCMYSFALIQVLESP
uniref:Fibronectin type-III domain-containing protein n=1 Tax=Panagrellus redivivus TaxID=6233 RepID=A0A7E4ZT25_PANRE